MRQFIVEATPTLMRRVPHMAYLKKDAASTFEPHPLFEKVAIAKLAGNEQQAPMDISLIDIEADAEIPVHTHDKSYDSIYVLSGQAEIYANGKWEKARAGDYFLVPPAEEHGVRNTGQDKLRLFIVHSPPLF